MGALVDANGLTEEEFLAQYKQKDYPKPSLTADVALFRKDGEGWQVLLVRRGGHPFLGCWALPGGFVEPGEDCDDAAKRELLEETGISGIDLDQYGLYSTPGRDPRAWTASGAYLAVVSGNCEANAGDDAAEARWFSLHLELAADNEDLSKQEFRLVAQAGDERLTATFTLDSHARFAPRTIPVASSGFAFDHGRLLADAFVRVMAIR